ncbi:MAG: tetratricopeptide repeat protein [Bacteroidales bacterium]|nr:tetratricopeptide repeat protein [Bacteroidales bacterium]
MLIVFPYHLIASVALMAHSEPSPFTVTVSGGTAEENAATQAMWTGDFLKMEKIHQRLADRLANDPLRELDFANELNSLGGAQIIRGKYQEAVQNLEKADAIRVKVLGRYHRYSITTVENLGIACIGTGDYRRAEQLRVILCRGRSPDSTVSELAGLWQRFAVLYREAGRFADSEICIQENLAILRTLPGRPTADEFAQYHRWLIPLYLETNQPEKARKAFEPVAKSWHPKLVHLPKGEMLLANHEYRAAADSLAYALLYEQTRPDPNPTKFAYIWWLIGRTEAALDDPTAQESLKRAVTFYKSSLGSDHPHYARSLRTLYGFFPQGNEALAAEADAIRERAKPKQPRGLDAVRSELPHVPTR